MLIALAVPAGLVVAFWLDRVGTMFLKRSASATGFSAHIYSTTGVAVLTVASGIVCGGGIALFGLIAYGAA